MQVNGGQKSTAIKVYVRVRPLVNNEIGTTEIIQVQEDNKTIKLTNDSLSCIEMKFDEAIANNATQKDVFALFKNYLPKIPQGYNMTVFAYGQTGSGKTYTMFGSDWQNTISKHLKNQHQNTFFQDLVSDENYAGLIPRTIYTLFEEIKIYSEQEKQQFNIYCSFLQIYNQKIYDLLQDFTKPKALNLHQSKLDGIFVEGLAEYAVTHYLDCLELMKRGQKNRFIRQTSMNTKSSRSHTIFQILLESTHPNSKGMFKKARLNLCDLAGSQKVNKSQEIHGDHFRELRNINQSLTTLGKVIASLSSQKKSIAAFRESKLTRLLQDSLTANTFTFIVGNISPSANNCDETFNTLKFVQRARHIIMKVKPMQFNGQSLEIVNKLQKQIQYLKELLNLKRKGMNPDDIHNKLVILQQENEKLKKSSVSIQDVEKLIDQNRKMKMQIHKLQMTQYAQSEIDNGDSRSDLSANSFHKNSHTQELQNYKQNGYEPLKYHNNANLKSQGLKSSSVHNLENQKYSPTQTKKSLVTAGKVSVQSHHSSMYSTPVPTNRNKEKQKILNKLEQLERIQKFNQEKLMKDLEQLEKKNQRKVLTTETPMKKKSKPNTITTLASQRKTGNYEDKIRQLEAKLFGK